ncbi:penicillin-binding transpeptidase domain-containing protein [Marinimicrobium sp. C6131]|uniref:peptidoglycan D,D-transpeptidase FtsI family protein n=1 Tax=Marinimicrobium sp. C6131 TaxID=3022676 RepID=UPI00223D7493|nr:penicillin-binding transpeptidase domain-containing protein [Marinimicrobium sp. C6131]UZJ46085.1 penicillin-binding transpeptidase domain-containing protein [Marinimicrobium sp. C6131]
MSRGQTLTIARWRVWLVALAVLLLGSALLWRLASLQVLPDTAQGYEFLQGQGQARTLRTEPISAYRGVITDRNGEPLAVSTPVETLWADPTLLLQSPERWSELARALELSEAELEARLSRYSGKEFMYLRRHLPPQAAEAVLKLEIPGVYSQREYRRYYPAGEVAAHLVGFTDIDDRGQEGMELAYDAWLSGENGAKQVLKDLRGRTVKELQLVKSARPGRNLALSIDLRLQYLAHRELKAAVQKNNAKGGSLVIMDVQTGEVLAMTNQPAYNPNDRSGLRSEALRNRALTDLFEPGSTMKPLAVMAALETGRFKPGSVIDTAPGYVQVGRKTLLDPVNYGVLDLSGVIAKSSQVGMTKLALELEPATVRNMYQRLGLGQGVGTGFPGESVGTLPTYERWRPIQRATYAFGYGLNLTAMQLVNAYSTVASGGIKRTPSLLRVDEVPDGERVVDEALARQVTAMLRRAVSTEGTARLAEIQAYPVAGKTGTVHKVGEGGYVENRYIASFVGMAPADNPRIVAAVIIDEPSDERYFGGQVAAPVFSSVAEGALRLLQVPPRVDEAKGIMVQDANKRGEPWS